MQISLKNTLNDNYLNEFVDVFLEKENHNERKKLLLDVKFKLEKSQENFFVSEFFFQFYFN